MTSDFDNDEIIDSAFPVDFNDDSNSLDMYGVWVKNAPRDASAEAELNGPSDITSPSRLAGIETYEDISSLPDLPDFDENPVEETEFGADLPADDPFAEDITWVEDKSEASFPDFGDTLPDLDDLDSQESWLGAENEPPAAEESDQSDTEPVVGTLFDQESETELPDIDLESAFASVDQGDTDESSEEEAAISAEFPDFGEVSFDETIDDAVFPDDFSQETIKTEESENEAEPVVNLSSSPLQGTEPLTDEGEIVFEDEAVEIEVPETDSTSEEGFASFIPEPASPSAPFADLSETEEISLDAFDMDETQAEEAEIPDISEDMLNNIEFEELTDTASFPEISEEESTEDLESAIEASFEAPASMETVESASIAYEETEETESIPAETFSIEDSLPSDDDFSGFLDELNSAGPAAIKTDSSVPSGDDLDLDSFIDQFNESGGRSEAETEKLFDDTDPVDLDLDFDEDFIADAQMIKETGASVSESEFMSSEFGVELIDETPASGAALSDDFDSLFDAAEDISEKPEASPSGTKESVSLEETNEFDDLLSSLDLSPAPSSAAKTTVKPKEQAKTFDLSVSEEDGAAPIAAPVTEASGEDIDVALFGENAGEVKAEPEQAETEMENSLTESDDSDEMPVEFTDEETKTEENLVIGDITDYNDMAQFPDTEDFATAAEGENVSADFDDISAVEKELSDMAPETGDIELNTSDKSTELLMLIADELSSIKQELSILKNELAGFKSVQAVPVPEEPVEAAQDSGGFFTDDDHDEAIALTGDELNNILITADFTEEKNEYAEEAAPASADAEENKAEEDYEVPDTLPDSIFDIPNLNDTSEIQVSHVNAIDEDMSYLEESDFSESDLDNVAIDESDIEVIDFNDEKLEEPELTEFNIDLDDIGVDFPAEQEIAKNEEEFPAFEIDQAEDELTPDKMEEDLSIPEDSLSEEAESFDLPDFSESVELPESEGSFETEESIDISNFDDSPEGPEMKDSFEVPDTDDMADFSEIDTESSTETDAESESPAFDETEVPPTGVQTLPIELKDEIKSVLSYMDQLLESLPENKIEEFARSEHFNVYKKLFEELGIS